MAEIVERQFGIVYGDGEMDEPFATRHEAEVHINRARAYIADGTWEAGDYEPMSMVFRDRILTTTDWQDTPDQQASEGGA